jgi:hypothetical protein
METTISLSLHNPLQVSGHAVNRINDRFGVSKQKAKQWAQERVTKAKFIAITTDETGEDARMFAYEGVAFILALDANFVKSAYAVKPFDDLREKVTALVTAELRKVEARTKRGERRTLTQQHEMERELADRNLELLRARSDYRKLALRGRIKALEARINEIPAEVTKVKRELTPYAKGVAAYV